MLSQADTLFRPKALDLKTLPSFEITYQEVKDLVGENAKGPIQKIIDYLDQATEEKKQAIADQLMKEINGLLLYSPAYSLHPKDVNDRYNRAMISAVKDSLMPHLTSAMAIATRKGETPYVVLKFAKRLAEIFGEDYQNAFVLRQRSQSAEQQEISQSSDSSDNNSSVNVSALTSGEIIQSVTESMGLSHTGNAADKEKKKESIFPTFNCC